MHPSGEHYALRKEDLSSLFGASSECCDRSSVCTCQQDRVVKLLLGFAKTDESHAVPARRDRICALCHAVMMSVIGPSWVQVAVGLGTPIMSEAWIRNCWERRDVM